MKELKTVSEVIESLSREKILPPFAIKLESVSLVYECGCGENHALNDSHHIASAIPKKFLVMCINSICTFVKVEGSPDEKTFSEWYITAETLHDVRKKLGL